MVISYLLSTYRVDWTDFDSIPQISIRCTVHDLIPFLTSGSFFFTVFFTELFETDSIRGSLNERFTVFS